ncbi:MAG: metallophosphoesterase, partial [Promethearchaeota archaeon]
LKLKVEYPEKVILLRGNHEEYAMNRLYGFHDTVKKHELLDVYEMYEEVFKELPHACYIKNIKVFCCHGLIPFDTKPVTFDEIRSVEKKKRYDDWHEITVNMLWSDPGNTRVPVTIPSFRGAGYLVSKSDFLKFIETNDIKLVIRSHYPYPEGHRFFFDKKMISIFSTPNYHGINKDASVVMISGNGDIGIYHYSGTPDDSEFKCTQTFSI